MVFREQLHQLGVASVDHIVTGGVLGCLADAALGSLESELSCVRLRSGDTLFSEGEPGDALYVVVFGRLRAWFRNGQHREHVLGEIGRGEAVGEMALLTDQPRSATVRAVRDTALVKLTKAAFHRVIERHPRTMLEMARLIVARYQRVIQPFQQTLPISVAVVPANAGIPAADFTASLVRALSSGRSVLCLDAERVQRERGAPADRLTQDLESADLARWLNEQELQHALVVYLADSTPSPWTQLCVRQADLVLLVAAGDPAAVPLPEVFDTRGSNASKTGARRELVVLHDSGENAPPGTAEWLARVPVSAHHHVDPHLPRDFERLARMLTGSAIGLVLGGGGARALAHIGVIRALEEAGIPIDRVGGTSSGAVIGAQYACGWNSARIVAESRKAFVDGGSLNDFTIPIVSLLRGRRYVRMLNALFGDRRIEDLPLPFFCVSTSLTRSASIVHRAGLLYKQVAASCAVPGLRPPTAAGREILVDGGVLNNLPVDLMRESGRGHVLASSVSPRADLCLNRNYPDIPSPWRVLVSWLNPFGTPMLVPSITTILMRTFSLQQMALSEPADLVVESPCHCYKQPDWRALDSIVETGYRAAVPVIERWQKAN